MSGGLVDAGSIPAASTNNEGHLFKVAFFIGHSHDKNGKRLLWCDNKSGAFDKPSFDPNRVAQSTITHRLDVHAYFCERGRIKLGNHGTKWISENNYPKNINYRPDAIFEVNNMTIALELERTAKTAYFCVAWTPIIA
jgi:hypothetical protein